jgi:hypothetical protein
MFRYLKIEAKTTDDDDQTMAFESYSYIELEKAKKINDYYEKYPDNSINVINRDIYYYEIIIKKVSIYTDIEVSRRYLYKTNYNTHVDMTTYIINRVKILELQKEIDDIYSSATKDLNDIIILKVRFYKLYYSAVESIDKIDYIFSYLNCTYIINDKNCDKFKIDLENYKKLILIDSPLKSYLINDLINIVKNYFSNEIIKTCITKKSDIEIFSTIPKPKQIPTDQKLVLNNKITLDYFTDEKYGFVFVWKNDLYYAICKYKNGKIKELSLEDKSIINYFGLCLQYYSDNDILEIEEFLSNSTLLN